MKRILYGVLALVLSACAGTPFAADEANVQATLAELEAYGQRGEAGDLLSSPFLFNGQIVTGEGETFFNELASLGHSFASGDILGTEPVNPDMVQLFGGTAESRIFFDKYVPEDAYLVSLQMSDSIWYFIVGDKVDDAQAARIYAIMEVRA